MKSLFVAVFTFCIIKSSAQFDFKVSSSTRKQVDFIADSLAKNITVDKDRKMDSAFALHSNYEFQFRLWELPSSISYSLFVLTLKNNTWYARYFNWHSNRNTKEELSEAIIEQSKLDQLWELLLTHNVLTLPSQHLLKKQMVEYKIDTTKLGHDSEGARRLEMMDGILYHLELSGANGKRFYNYGCPKFYFEKYPNIEELYHVVSVIMLIKKYLGLPVNSVCKNTRLHKVSTLLV